MSEQTTDPLWLEFLATAKDAVKAEKTWYVFITEQWHIDVAPNARDHVAHVLQVEVKGDPDWTDAQIVQAAEDLLPSVGLQPPPNVDVVRGDVHIAEPKSNN